MLTSQPPLPIGAAPGGALATVSFRRVPRNLVMVKEKTTLSHAKNMYAYRHIFNPNITSQAYSNEGEPRQYKDELEELKGSIVIYAKARIPGRIVAHFCNLGFRMSDGQMPTSLTDVYAIISVKGNWNEKMQSALHYIMYDQHRKGSDEVSVLAAGWMRENRIEYVGNMVDLPDGTTMELETTGTGFVQGIMLKWRTTMNEGIQWKCLTAHDEYVGNRKGRKPNEFEYNPIEFSNRAGKGKAYLVKRKATVPTGITQSLGTNHLGTASVTNRDEAITMLLQTLRVLVPVVEPHLEIGDMEAALADAIAGTSLMLTDPFSDVHDSTWDADPALAAGVESQGELNGPLCYCCCLFFHVH